MSRPITARIISTPRSLGVLGATVAVLVGLGVTAAPAHARPDPGEPVVSHVCDPFTDPRTLPVERLGIHWVRCDYLVR